MNSKLFYILILIFGFFSCSEEQRVVEGIDPIIHISQKPKDAANQLCDCLTKGEVTKIQSWMSTFDNPSALSHNMDIAGDCLKEIIASNKEYIQSLPVNEQKTFVKEFLHAFIESDCIDIALKSIPDPIFDQLLNN